MAMEELSNFVGQNYFWILIIGVVFIMALIGFIADKKNLVKLEKKHKKEDHPLETNESSESNEKIEPVEENYNNIDEQDQKEKESIEELYQPIKTEDDAPKEIIDDIANEIPEELYAPLGDSPVEPVSNEAYTEGIKTVNGLEVVDLDSLHATDSKVNFTTPYEQTASQMNDVPAELYAPLETSPVQEERVVSTPSAGIDVDLPDLNTVNQEDNNAAGEENIWKF